MELTPENKAYIKSLSVKDLLERWRFAPVGDEWFQGETGDYWGQRLEIESRRDPGGYVAASKAVGWDKDREAR